MRPELLKPDFSGALGYNTPQEILDLHNNPQEAA